MIPLPTATCPTTGTPTAERDCSRPLVLADCLAAWQRDAHHGVFDTGRYRCRYVVWGRGPALILVPGMSLDAIGFAMLMARLQGTFCCISFDLPNGDSDGARVRSYHHDDHVADLFSLLDHLSVRECFLLGSSFGSTIGLAAMQAQPERFARAILQGSFARRTLARAEVLAASFARFLPGRLWHLPFTERVLEQQMKREFLSRDPALWDFFVELNLKTPLRAFASRALLIHRLDLTPILPTIQQPTLLVCGDRDPLVCKECEEELKRGLPHVTRGEIEQCGHFPQLTHPEVLAEVVQQFFATPTCESPL